MKLRYLLMILVMLTSGCSDPSPLRSNVEVQINQTFGTKFGLIDQLIIKNLKKNEIVAVLNPEHFSNSLGKMKKVKGRLLKPNYAIYLKTSKESEAYSKEQTEATLLYDSEKELICTENKKLCYETSDSLRTFLIDNQMK